MTALVYWVYLSSLPLTVQLDGRMVALCTFCIILGGLHSLLVALIGNVHKSVDGSLFPRKMTFPSYITLQIVLANITLHPVLHSTLIPIKDAIDSLGTACPTKTVGSPGMVMLHVCVDLTLLPSGKFMVSGWIAGQRF